YPTATRSSAVREASKAMPIEGKATLATAKFRLATAAARISAARTSPARRGPPVGPETSDIPRLSVLTFGATALIARGQGQAGRFTARRGDPCRFAIGRQSSRPLPTLRIIAKPCRQVLSSTPIATSLGAAGVTTRRARH